MLLIDTEKGQRYKIFGGFVCGAAWMRWNMRCEAVRAGAGQWQCDQDGNSQFSYKGIKP